MTTFYPHRLGPFDRSGLAGQFVLSSRSVAAPIGWSILTEGRWTLATHPALPVSRILNGRDDTIGWLLGHAIMPEGRLVDGDVRLDRPWLNRDPALESLVDGLAGRFLVILLSGPNPRLYPDCLAMLAAVFAPQDEVVASTSSLIPQSPSTGYNLTWIVATDVPYSSAMYPLGLTPRCNVERVLPNHYLDLARWVLVRRWPSGDLHEITDIAGARRRVAALASQRIEAVAAAVPIQAPLTAGRDSRVLLACSRNALDRITFFTAEMPGHLTGWRDVRIARAIADGVGLRHAVLPHVRPRRSDLRGWVERTAGETGEPGGWRSTCTFQQVARDRATLIGWGADIVRPIYWKGLRADSPITAGHILAICGVEPLPDFVARAESWLQALPTSNAITVMDLLLMEQRGGCWAGTIEYAEDGYSLRRLNPLCHAEIIRTLMALPKTYRREMVFERDLIAAEWPELLDFPFNEQVAVGAVRDRYYRVRETLGSAAARLRAFSRRGRVDPGWAGRKMMKRLFGSRAHLRA